MGHDGKWKRAESEGFEQPTSSSQTIPWTSRSLLDGGGVRGGEQGDGGRLTVSSHVVAADSGGFSSLSLMDATSFPVVFFLGSSRVGRVPCILCLGSVGEGGGTPQGGRWGGRKCSLPVKPHCFLGLCRHLRFVPCFCFGGYSRKWGRNSSNASS